MARWTRNANAMDQALDRLRELFIQVGQTYEQGAEDQAKPLLEETPSQPVGATYNISGDHPIGAHMAFDVHINNIEELRGSGNRFCTEAVTMDDNLKKFANQIDHLTKDWDVGLQGRVRRHPAPVPSGIPGCPDDPGRFRWPGGQGGRPGRGDRGRRGTGGIRHRMA